MSFKKENPVVEKSYAFAIRIVKCYQLLRSEKQSYDLATQLVKSGTSIGANIEEAQGSISKREFIAKMHISYKEARETHFWLRLFMDTDILKEDLATSMLEDCEELLKLLTTILKSSKQTFYSSTL